MLPIASTYGDSTYIDSKLGGERVEGGRRVELEPVEGE